MVAEPTDTPVTIPVEPTVTVASALLHVPPRVASPKLIDPPTHIEAAPVIGRIGFTVTVVVTIQPDVPVE